MRRLLKCMTLVGSHYTVFIFIVFQCIQYCNNWPQNRPALIRPLLPRGDGGMSSTGDRRQKVNFSTQGQEKIQNSINNLQKWRKPPKHLEPNNVLFYCQRTHNLLLHFVKITNKNFTDERMQCNSAFESSSPQSNTIESKGDELFNTCYLSWKMLLYFDISIK